MLTPQTPSRAIAMGRAGRARVERLFSLQAYARQLQDAAREQLD